MSDTPTHLDLDAIKSSIAACRTYNFGMYQADRLAHEHAPALLAEVKRLRAEVADLRATVSSVWDEGIARCCTGDASQDDGHHKSCRHVHGDLRPDPDDRETLADAARPAPAWDEDAVAEAVRRDLEAAGILPWTNGGARIVRTALAVVRHHLPVKPSREDVVRALAVSDVHHPDFCDCGQPVCGGTCDVEGEDCFCAAERCDGLEQQINAALGLWPGRSEVEVKAEGLREAARAVENDERDGSPSVRELVGSTDRALSVEAWLRARADRLATEGGAS